MFETSGDGSYQPLLLKFEDRLHEKVTVWMLEASEEGVMPIHMSAHGLGPAGTIECLKYCQSPHTFSREDL